MDFRRYTAKNPTAQRMGPLGEVAQRARNVRNMLTLAWCAARYDSLLFSVVLVNSVRTLGDGLIAQFTPLGASQPTVVVSSDEIRAMARQEGTNDTTTEGAPSNEH